MKKPWIDVSIPLRSGMVHWPKDPACTITRAADMDKGAVCNLTKVDMCAHVGTHMDGPLHFVKDGDGLDTLPFEATLGTARVVQINHRTKVTPEELSKQRLRRGERILLRTRNSRRRWDLQAFDEEFVHIGKEAAQFLVDAGIRTIGIDYLSVGGFGPHRDGVETHQILLGAKVWIIEGLYLAKTPPGRYDLICLPVKMLRSDGAPARVILRPRGR